MMKPILVPALFLLVSFQVHGFPYFDLESEFPQHSKATEFSYEPRDISGSNPEEAFLLPESEFPQYSSTSLFSESELPQDSLEAQNFPQKASQSSKNEFPKEFEYPAEYFEAQVPYEIETDAVREFQAPTPSPSETPSPSPSPAPAPVEAENSCKFKCSLKCREEKFSLLKKLCNQVCKSKCLLRYSVQIYHCTIRCADSMPEILKSDKKKSSGYVDYCFKNCLKRF